MSGLISVFVNVHVAWPPAASAGTSNCLPGVLSPEPPLHWRAESYWPSEAGLTALSTTAGPTVLLGTTSVTLPPSPIVPRSCPATVISPWGGKTSCGPPILMMQTS